MLRSAQPSQFSTYPIQNIDIPGLAVLFLSHLICHLRSTPLEVSFSNNRYKRPNVPLYSYSFIIVSVLKNNVWNPNLADLINP